MYELSLRKVHGFWENVKYIFFPWVKVVPLTPEMKKELPQEEKKYEPSEVYRSGRPLNNVMTTLAVIGVVAAAYFAHRYGVF